MSEDRAAEAPTSAAKAPASAAPESVAPADAAPTFAALESAAPTDAGTRHLPFQQPYDVRSALLALEAHDVPGMQLTSVAERRHVRTVRGPAGPLVATVVFAASHVELRADVVALGQPRAALEPAPPSLLDWLEPKVRRWLDLDLDPARVAMVLSRDDILRPLLAARPGLRVLGCTDGFEAAVGAVLGQQVSIAAGRTFAGRLVSAYGESVTPRLRAFPQPRTIATQPAAELQRRVGVTGARARTLVGLAGVFASGFVVDWDSDPKTVRDTLMAVPGIGVWTVDQVRMRALGDRDVFPAGDLVLRRALAVKTPAEAEALAAGWRPFRAYATYHLWTRTAYARQE